MKHDDIYIDKVLSYSIMRKALNKCCRNVRWKDSIVGYELHAPEHTYNLIEEIKTGKYKISDYQKFTIYEPKEREIVATRIRDRQVQMAMCLGGLYDDITEHFIYDNCACQIGKGTDFALNRVRTHLLKFYRQHNGNGYVLKLDVKHFFPSTLHSVAKRAIKKRVTDPTIYKMVCDIIDSFEGDKGIGLGSQISQLVELAVLDDIDHFIKEKLHIKYYVRYMDDMVLIHEDKEYLRYCWREIEKELNKIHLELNKKSCMYPLSQGVKFLHWRFILTQNGGVNRKFDKTKIAKERCRLKALLIKEMNGSVECGTAHRSLEAWCANADRGDTFFQQKRMRKYYKQVKGALYGNNNSRMVA
jgi:hypothetical protein